MYGMALMKMFVSTTNEALEVSFAMIYSYAE